MMIQCIIRPGVLALTRWSILQKHQISNDAVVSDQRSFGGESSDLPVLAHPFNLQPQREKT